MQAVSTWTGSLYLDAQSLFGRAVSKWTRSLYLDGQSLLGRAVSTWTLGSLYLEAGSLYLDAAQIFGVTRILTSFYSILPPYLQ